MGWLDRRRRQEDRPPQVQLREESAHPFGAMRGYVPLQNGEIRLYRSIREAVPIRGRSDFEADPAGGRRTG